MKSAQHRGRDLGQKSKFFFNRSFSDELTISAQSSPQNDLIDQNLKVVLHYKKLDDYSTSSNNDGCNINLKVQPLTNLDHKVELICSSETKSK